MFETLSERFSQALRKISGKGQISESNVREAMEEVRTALMEADVHYDVVQQFADKVLEDAIGADVVKSVQPGEQMIAIVHERLVELMGPVDSELMEVSPGPTIVMMSGLQGSGKTTTCGKLAARLKKQGKKVMLCAADLQRPAAVQQLMTLVEQVNQTVEGRGSVVGHAELDKVAEYGKAVGVAVKVCQNALRSAREQKVDVLILDTAGRLHINDDLMGELKRVERAVQPHHIFLVVDAMTGQDAVNSARAFNEQLELDGVILTKFDSDTRGGAALSVKQITGKPIKFIGVGEQLDALEDFRPEGMASRILGMGDVVGLVRKAQEQVSQEEAEQLQNKLSAGKMTLDDFLNQLKAVRRMGSFKSVLGMLPGIGQQLKGLNIEEDELNRTEAMIGSMTLDERRDPEVFNNSRRRRVARGSGTSPEEIGQLIKSFGMINQMGKSMGNLSDMGRFKTMAGMSPGDLQALSSGKARLQGGAKPGDRSQKFKQRRKKSR